MKPRKTRLNLVRLEDRLAPAVFTVLNLNDSGPDSLRDCVAKANAAAGFDSVVFGPSVVGTITLTSGEIIINDTVSIGGPGKSLLTISGGKSQRIFNIASTSDTKGAISITSLTLSDGFTSGFVSGGSAIRGTAPSLSLSNCALTSNIAASGGISGAGIGGAIALSGGSLTVNNCLLSGNSATTRGGAITLGGGSIQLSNSTVSNNTAGQGGGIYASNNVTIIASTFSGNSAVGTGRGGGILIQGSTTPTIIRNSTFSGNVADLNGGAIAISSTTNTLTLQNSTITGNSITSTSTDSGGGGIARIGGSTSTIALESMIVSGNVSTLGPDILSAGTVNLKTSAIGSGSGFSKTDLGGNLAFGTNIKLGPLQNNGGPMLTHLPASDSPLIDAGSNPASLPTDQRGSGFPRVIGIAADIGAVEIANFVVRTTANSGVGSLRQTIQHANTLPGPDIIIFDPAIVSSATSITLNSEIAINDAITINWPGSTPLTLNGNTATRIFNISGAGVADIALSKLRFVNAKVSGNGAAISGGGQNLTITSCHFENNVSTGNGGAVSLTFGPLTASDCVFTDNRAIGVASTGGAVFTLNGTFTNCEFEKSFAEFGGAVGLDISGAGSTPSLSITGSGFIDNIASSFGGAVMYRTTSGGGNFSIQNSTLSSNSAASQGGAIYTQSNGTNLTISSSTIARNQAPNAGGGLQILGAILALESTIVAQNFSSTGPDLNFGSNVVVPANHNIIGVAGTGNFTLSGTANSTGTLAQPFNPEIEGLSITGGTARTHRPLPGSHAIDAGNNTAALATDQRGLPRAVGQADIGAVEFQTNDAPPEEFISDINRELDRAGAFPSVFGEIMEVNGKLFFTAETAAEGRELWFSDGTSSGTRLVRDINPGPGNASPRSLTNVGGILYFSASDGLSGQLWRSDGTSSGTNVVHDVLPGTIFERSFINFGGILLFAASDNISGAELWRSDGTSSGTFLIRDINPGLDSSFPYLFTNVNGTIFFNANNGVNGSELWRTNGTSTGTFLVRDINAGSANSSPRDLTNVGSVLYFSANDGAHGRELWRYDGTSAGTTMISDIQPGPISSDPENLIERIGTLYFSARDSVNGSELWRSNGTSMGTIIVRDINPGSSGSGPSFLINANGVLMFAATDGVNGRELWRSNGTSTGTLLVRNINPGADDSSLNHLTNVSGQVYFRANDGTGHELWRSDGTSTGTTLIRDINASGSSYPDNLTNIGGKLFFSACDNVNGRQLWQSDGTLLGTRLVHRPENNNADSQPNQLINLGGVLYFSANDGLTGYELWRSDGTSTGTRIVRDINPGSQGSNISNLVGINDVLYFTTFGVNSDQIWRSDGTSSGTQLIPGQPATFTFNPEYLTNVDGVLYFAATDGINGRELWRTDGTASGTLIVRDINPGSEGSYPFDLTNVNGTLFFRANDGINGAEIWASDGTSSGTRLVRDIRPGSNTSSPLNLVNVNGTLFFRANDGVGGIELWKSDGSFSGTQLISDINPGAANSFPFNLTNVGGLLYFTADNGINGRELWHSNGTSTGTFLTRDIWPGADDGFIASLTAVGNLLFFRANDGVNGFELWRSDGSSAGTTIVRDIHSGSAGSYPASLVNNLGVLYFSANHGANGFELWRSDGTSAGTRLDGDLVSPGSSSPHSLTPAGSRLFFSAVSSIFGRELVAITPPVITTITTTADNGVFSTGQTLPISLNFSEPITLTGGAITLSLDSGGSVVIQPGSGTSLTGQYTILAGQTTPDLTVLAVTLDSTASITDSNGNNAILILPLNNLAQTANLIINPLPPTTLQAIIVNQGDSQRSRITEIQLNFAAPVDAAQLNRHGVVALTRTASGPPLTITTGAEIILTPSSGLVTSVTLKFTGNVGVEHGSLADGRWQLTIPWLSFSSPLNDPNLRRLFGDADGNGTVDSSDFATFGSVFGSSGSNIAFDFDDNGTIDSTDFAQFGTRFGISL